MSRENWKEAERRLGRIFKVRRRIGSGAYEGEGRDDCLHPILYLENKQLKAPAIWTLFEDTKRKADKENRIPVIGIQKNKKHGILLVIHSSDFERVIIEYLTGNKKSLENVSNALDDAWESENEEEEEDE